MRVTVVQGGPFANESEERALQRLKTGLISLPGNQEWFLLTNLMFSVTNRLQSDEIDIVAVGPPGVQVIEVKHWKDRHQHLAEREADLLTNKTKKIASTLRKVVPGLPFVGSAFLITTQRAAAKRLLARKRVRGVPFHPLTGWRTLVQADEPGILEPLQAKRLVSELKRRSGVRAAGSLRQLAGYVNLEELPQPPGPHFHRVYKGVHSRRRDRVFLHLYDFSASEEATPKKTARREYEALHRLQLRPWAPRILDSFQDVPGYRDEMSYFTIVDPAAPNIESRASDTSWPVESRLDFALNTVRALKEMHEGSSDRDGMTHRNLAPRNILVKHDNKPILTGLQNVRIPSEYSLDLSNVPPSDWSAPEVRERGLGTADPASDVYSLCASLLVLFENLTAAEDATWEAGEAVRVLRTGKTEPENRASLMEVESGLKKLVTGPAELEVPPARFWTEDQVVRFRDQDYRIVSRLGTGGVGTTFKVVQLDASTREDMGTFVGKVVRDQKTGERVRLAHQLAREPVSRRPGLSSVLEVAKEWRDNEFVALMTWIEGSSLADFSGVIPLLAEDQSEEWEEFVLRWMRAVCEALDALHRNGFVHGDVSPRNMIVSEGDLVLTDYDFVTHIGAPTESPDTMYCSPTRTDKTAVPSDDIYSLAASFFHVLFDRVPFSGQGHVPRMLDWEETDRAASRTIADFLDRATHPDPDQRFETVADALEALAAPGAKTIATDTTRALPVATERTQNQVPWLRDLLQSYPGSMWGNLETRGLDTEFAKNTYVETELETTLYKDVLNRRARLVVLCGNAGDGKTALLQYLAEKLGLGDHASSERILDGTVGDGLRVRVNLDGSAAWKGRSADELLDKFLKPFEQGAPDDDIAHLLAINDGRLLEWVGQPSETPLKRDLTGHLGDEPAENDHISFHNLNERSLVGGVSWENDKIKAEFLEKLVDALYGGDEAPERWKPCATCSAQERCSAYRALRVFGPDGLPNLESQELRSWARQRLFEALQAVHFRGETHITVRELRATLVFILFGIHFCQDYHDGTAELALPYWDRAFSPDAPHRQGEVLAELVRLDPALEAHPKIDRRLLAEVVETGDRTKHLSSARRRAYFEWTDGKVRGVQGTEDPDGGTTALALGLAQGQHLAQFRNMPFLGKAQYRKLSVKLCRGIAKLATLPLHHVALDVVPLPITPRTPTETAFWSEKPFKRFRLRSELRRPVSGEQDLLLRPYWERLHRYATLEYTGTNGTTEDLRLSYDLFHCLLEMADGYQFGDASADDVFANLSRFCQRLVREDDRVILAWNPVQDDETYRISVESVGSQEGVHQRLTIRRIDPGTLTK